MEYSLGTPKDVSKQALVGLGSWVGLGMSRTAMQSYSDLNSYRYSSIHCLYPIENLSEHESKSD